MFCDVLALNRIYVKTKQKNYEGYREIQWLKFIMSFNELNFSQHTIKNSPFYQIILLPDKKLVQFKRRCLISV